jgi:hypothetical protein
VPTSLLDRFRRIRRLPSPASVAALAVFAVALGVRLLWVALVESPYANVFSDMEGYVNRAHQVAYGNGDPDPIFATLYPPGAHLVYAAEMKLVGFEHHAPMLLVNCLWGAVVAPCATLLALRIVPRLSVGVGVGLLAALWYPLLAFAGFFSSEQPYAGAVAVSAWLLVRQIESGKSAVALGVFSAIAYLVRPQVVLTLAALTVLGVVLLLREPLGRRVPLLRFLRRIPGPRLHVGRLVVAGCILTAAVGYGAVRYHRLSGRWGLVSDNSAMTRLWADTNYGRIKSKQGYFFQSPPKSAIRELRELDVDGYVGDPVVIDRARRGEVAYMTTWERVRRWAGNVRFLFSDNDLWPPNLHEGTGWRHTTYLVTRRLLLWVFWPLALVGIVSTFLRPSVVSVVCSAHVLTMIVVAAFFFAEQRYRVPYDVFIVLLALQGVRWLGTLTVPRGRPSRGRAPA